MSFSKNLTITVKNTDAQLNEPLYVYEKDRNLIVYFKIMDYKYKFDKNPTNVLASVDDIMEAYATIVDPNGYELTRQYGEVIEDEIKFIVTNDLVDELDELGTYRLQFHIKCQHSEFTIPEISFEVLERLKGFRTITDEGEVGDEILNNSESFIDAEGKLHLVWQEGDTISSVRLNQMVQVINNAVDEEHQRQINEVNRENRANAKLEELETRFSALTASQQQSSEIIDARDGETSLKARLDRDIEKAKQVYVNVEGSHISTDSNVGYLKDVEIKGNTIQDPNNLADIRSLGDKVEGQELYEIPVLSCGKNLANVTLWYDNKTINSTGTVSDEVGPNSTVSEFISIAHLKEAIDYAIPKPSNTTGGITIAFYDMNKAFLSRVFTNIFTVPSEAKYIRVKTGIDNKQTFQLEEGTRPTPYEPYQEDKLTILSPVQLEKVGDVADRIICKDGVWGVEKNIATKVFDGSDDENIFYYKNYAILSDIEYSRTYISTHNVSIITWNGVDRFSIKDSSITDILSAKQWLQNNPITIKIPTTHPQFIPLPHDQQVKLRTFANKTNISFGCEIEGTIKAQVPKSLGATVNTHTTQISNLNKELDRVKKLEESTVSTVETESDFTTVEATSGGYFEDVKLEGKTLVNLCPKPNAYAGDGDIENRVVISGNVVELSLKEGYYTGVNFASNSSLMKPNTTYTIVANILENTMTKGNLAIIEGNPDTSFTGVNIPLGYKGVFVIKATTRSSYILPRIQSMTTTTCKTGEKVKFSLMVFEGDHTQQPPNGYIEGLKSVGQDVDEIVVSSVNENLHGTLYANNSYILYSSSDMSLISNSDYDEYFISVEPNASYTIHYNESTNTPDLISNFVFSDCNENKIKGIANGTTVTAPANAKYMFYAVNHSCTNVKIEKGNIVTDYTPHQADKKRLLYYNEETQTWEKPILREWDSIEKHTDGKYYYHQRSGEVVLNGSEDWTLYSDPNSTECIPFEYIVNDKYSNSNTKSLNLVNDKFIVKDADTVYAQDIEGIVDRLNLIRIKIKRSKLSTQDVAGFKQWLQANNVTVVYQLAEEKVYECTNIDLITYANETNYIVESGAIVPKSTLKVHSNIANVISALQKKVSVLESNYVTLFNTITAAFNSLE